MTEILKSRKMEADMAEDRHLWRLGVDGWLLDIYVPSLQLWPETIKSLKLIKDTLSCSDDFEKKYYICRCGICPLHA